MSQLYDPKDPTETIVLDMDFSSILLAGETIASAVWRIVRTDQGEDTGSMVSGSYSILGTTIRQNITGGSAGGSYLHSITATTNAGNVLVATAAQKVSIGA